MCAKAQRNSIAIDVGYGVQIPPARFETIRDKRLTTTKKSARVPVAPAGESGAYFDILKESYD